MKTKEIYLAGGCFWGTEHYFKQIEGVLETEVGFANGHTENPTYKEVYRTPLAIATFLSRYLNLPDKPNVRNNMKQIVYSFILIALFLSACRSNTPKSEITAETAYEGVNNYCHSTYDWSVAEENPSIMYVTMGEETDSTYQVIFRSYTAAMTYFYVNKATGATRMVEYVPALDIENETGTINIFDYLKKK